LPSHLESDWERTRQRRRGLWPRRRRRLRPLGRLRLPLLLMPPLHTLEMCAGTAESTPSKSSSDAQDHPLPSSSNALPLRGAVSAREISKCHIPKVVNINPRAPRPAHLQKEIPVLCHCCVFKRSRKLHKSQLNQFCWCHKFVSSGRTGVADKRTAILWLERLRHSAGRTYGGRNR